MKMCLRVGSRQLMAKDMFLVFVAMTRRIGILQCDPPPVRGSDWDH
jgi:hypothetical protein